MLRIVLRGENDLRAFKILSCNNDAVMNPAGLPIRIAGNGINLWWTALAHGAVIAT
jgi:hypothetical protein